MLSFDEMKNAHTIRSSEETYLLLPTSLERIPVFDGFFPKTPSGTTNPLLVSPLFHGPILHSGIFPMFCL